jgi:hypothetical protein
MVDDSFDGLTILCLLFDDVLLLPRLSQAGITRAESRALVITVSQCAHTQIVAAPSQDERV